MHISTKVLAILALVALVAGASSAASSGVWGVNPAATGAELVNIDPITGVIAKSYGLPDISVTDTEIGLAGWTDALYYINSNYNPSLVSVINPANGSVVNTFGLIEGYEVDGLGYWQGAAGAFVYSSGCPFEDMHRYTATDFDPAWGFWSDAYDPQAVAGDIGGRIFTYAADVTGLWAIFEVDPLDIDAPLTYFAASPSDSIVGMAYDGTHLFLSDLDNKLYTVDNTGTLVNTLDLDFTLFALASTEISDVVIPSPGAILLAGIGACIVGRLRRRHLL